MKTDDPNDGKTSRRDFTATLLGAAAWLVVPRAPQSSNDAESAADYILQSDVMVAMRDGVRLATDIYLPVTARTGSTR
jgi:predicted acyl esterase